jgi:hypothetical protein
MISKEAFILELLQLKLTYYSVDWFNRRASSRPCVIKSRSLGKSTSLTRTLSEMLAPVFASLDSSGL